MKQTFLLLFIATLLTGMTGCALRPSPPAKVSETINSGAKITIDYSRPGIKDRTIGNEIAPWGKVWRTGANKATVFEVSKDVKVEGESLPAGKYSLYSIPGQSEWTIILNRDWDQSGTIYDQARDILRVNVKTLKVPAFAERMTFKIAKEGIVSLVWGDYKIDFRVE